MKYRKIIEEALYKIGEVAKEDWQKHQGKTSNKNSILRKMAIKRIRNWLLFGIIIMIVFTIGLALPFVIYSIIIYRRLYKNISKIDRKNIHIALFIVNPIGIIALIDEINYIFPSPYRFHTE